MCKEWQRTFRDDAACKHNVQAASEAVAITRRLQRTFDNTYDVYDDSEYDSGFDSNGGGDGGGDEEHLRWVTNYGYGSR